MNNLFRKLPKIDILMNDESFNLLKEKISYNSFYQLVKEEIEIFRNRIKNREISDFEVSDIISEILKKSQKNEFHLKRVINGSGVIIHTNLGRSVLNRKMFDKVTEVATNYNNLEYKIETGKRGNRNSHVEDIICKLTGAEAALVVNNNAAAVVIALHEFARDKESIVSRGELVEIGGSFRIPDIMELSRSTLKEVGTTNKTHLRDYENAISENTGLILKVHQSNFKIVGFTESVSNSEIADLGKKHNILTMEDLGSGVLVDFSKYGVRKEPTVQESIASGIDLVTISGDKLLGGPQCGIILGKKELIERLKKNQYLRAFRVDKLVLATLEMTLKLYLDEREAIREIPTLRMITESPSLVLERANTLKEIFDNEGISTKIIESRAKIGGGSMPEETVPSYALTFINKNPLALEEAFRLGDINIIGRISNNEYILDLKTISEDEFEIVLEKAKQIKELRNE